MVKNLLSTWDTRVWSLVWEDPLVEGTATHSSILAWETHGQRSLAGYRSKGLQRVRHDWRDLLALLLSKELWSHIMQAALLAVFQDKQWSWRFKKIFHVMVIPGWGWSRYILNLEHCFIPESSKVLKTKTRISHGYSAARLGDIKIVRL